MRLQKVGIKKRAIPPLSYIIQQVANINDYDGPSGAAQKSLKLRRIHCSQLSNKNLLCFNLRTRDSQIC